MAGFRYQIRAFLRFSEAAAKKSGVEPRQHQLMLEIKALEPEAASIRSLAERLLLRHHSVVGLVDRLEKTGMVKRTRSAADRRSTQVRLTPKGTKVLRGLSFHHREELRSAIPDLIESLTWILNGTESKHAQRA